MATKNIQKKKSERIIGDMYENGELIAVKANKNIKYLYLLPKSGLSII